MNMGSASFWRTFRSFSAENLESVSPSQFTERIVILVQKQGLFDKGLAERFETSYLARSSEFNSSDSIGMFSLFA
jgi:predicted NodU family carbamoyl transferase